MFRNLIWGWKWGLVYASVFASIATARILLVGESDVALPLIITFYVVAGVIGGGVVGLFRPLVYFWWGAVLVGALAGVAAALPLLAVFLPAEERWSLGHLVIGSMIGIIWGVVGGFGLRAVWR